MPGLCLIISRAARYLPNPALNNIPSVFVYYDLSDLNYSIRTLISECSDPYSSATHVTSQVLQPKSVNKVRGRHTLISVSGVYCFKILWKILFSIFLFFTTNLRSKKPSEIFCTRKAFRSVIDTFGWCNLKSSLIWCEYLPEGG